MQAFLLYARLYLCSPYHGPTSPRSDPQRGLLGVCPGPGAAPRKAARVCAHRPVGSLLPVPVFEEQGRQRLGDVPAPSFRWVRCGFPLVLRLRGFLLPRGASLRQRPARGICTSGAAGSGGLGWSATPPPISEDPVCSAPPCSDPTGLTTPHLIISTDLGGPTAQVPQQGSLLALKVTSEAISASLLRLGLLSLNPKSFLNPRLEGVGWVAAGARGAGRDREAQPGE